MNAIEIRAAMARTDATHVTIARTKYGYWREIACSYSDDTFGTFAHEGNSAGSWMVLPAARIAEVKVIER